MRFAKLSIIVPVFNELATLSKVWRQLTYLKLPVGKEVIWVDDGSQDGSGQWLKKQQVGRRNLNVKFVYHQNNQGKGAAVASGLALATGDYVVIFDADGECDAHDLVKMTNLVKEKGYSVLFGTRKNSQYLYWHFYWGVRLLAGLVNRLYGQNISDPEMGMKLVRRSLFNFPITENGFGQEIEITAKLALQGIQIEEIPVAYYPRTFAQGKKMTAQDGLRAIYLVFKYRLDDFLARLS